MTELRLLEGYEFDDDPARIDVDSAWRFLSTEAYWSRWRTRSDFETQLANSWRVVGGYEVSTGRMVAFARAVSDGVGLAYLADVHVHPEYRGRGLGVAVVDAMIERGPGAHFRWMLHTADAHDMYAKFGFARPDDRYLERAERRPS